MQNKSILGVDIGNVIINNRLNNPEVVEVTETVYRSFPASEGVFDALKTLNEYCMGEVYLVSKCTEWAQEQILHWLDFHDFYIKTEIKKDHVHFVRQRHEKDGVCRTLGVTHFIDDRLEVLSHMIQSTPHLILFQPNSAEVKEFEQFLSHVQVANDWNEVVDFITKSN